MSQTVAEVLVNALESIGVKHIFGLIGDSLNPLADAVRRSGIDWIGVRHEEGGALAAAGQAKLTGPRKYASRRRPLRSGPRSRACARDLWRHAAKNARYGFYSDHRTRSVVSRRFTLHRNDFVSGAGTGGHSSGYCRILWWARS